MQILPKIVIAGRPNTGKSTLFNRLTRSRKAITGELAGLTRDGVETEIALGSKKALLVDSGGFKLERPSALDKDVHQKTLRLLDEAALIVLLLEAGDVTQEDEEFIDYLRKYADKLVVCVNKTEGARKTNESYNYLTYGFDKLLFISAEHGDNIGELQETLMRELASKANAADNEGESEEKEAIKIAIVGKPNSGKSTLANRLLGEAKSIVNETAGTTRDVVEGEFYFKGERFITLDTAGMRRRGKVDEDVEYYSVNRAVKAIKEADVAVLLLDATEGLSDQDKKIASLACEAGRGLIVALNKWDLMPDVKNAFNAVEDRIRFLFGSINYAPIIKVSAKTGDGIDALLNWTQKMHKQLTRKIETSTLNEALARWQVEYPPPAGPRKHFSIKYGTQTGVNPVTFTLFATRPFAVQGNYEHYIENKIRSTLNFSCIPIKVEWKSTHKKKV